MKHSIAIIIAYFGQWPFWINFFVETCRSNSDIDWIIFSDCGQIENNAKNVQIIEISFRKYKQLVSEKLGIFFDPPNPYKLCDIKPAFGFLHSELVKNYDFIGFGDLDVFYGHIRDFYNYEILKRYSLLSTHPERVSGHFFLMRNVPHIIQAFKRVPNWGEYMSNPSNQVFDENHFTKALYDMKANKCSLKRKSVHYLFQERYSTPGPTNNMNWYWKDGILSNEFYCFNVEKQKRGFLYLHFMNWMKSHWYSYYNYISQVATAPWEGRNNVININWQKARNEGFMINPNGIRPIVWPLYNKRKV